MARRYAEADGLRARFGGCKTMASLAKDVSDARFEDMKFIKPSSIAEPTRSMLLSAKDGDMLPPVTAADGIEVYAVCGRRAIKADEKAAGEGAGGAGAEGVRDRRQAPSPRPQAGCAHRISMSGAMVSPATAVHHPAHPSRAAVRRDDGRSRRHRPGHHADELAPAARQGLPAFVLYGDPDALASGRAPSASTCRWHPVASLRDAAAAFADALPVWPVPMAAPGAQRQRCRHRCGHRAGDGGSGRRGGARRWSPTRSPRRRSIWPACPTPATPNSWPSWPPATAAGTRPRPVMMLVAEELKVVPTTVHIPLSAVPAALTRPLLLETIRITAAALARDFGIAQPRIAVAGLNPHAGEGGLIGSEERASHRAGVAELARRRHRRHRPALRRHAVPRRGAGARYDAASPCTTTRR